MEVLREERTKGPPIRRTFVAWGVIRREGRFILKRRENREDDPDNALHGNYGFPGGRVNLKSRSFIRPHRTRVISSPSSSATVFFMNIFAMLSFCR